MLTIKIDTSGLQNAAAALVGIGRQVRFATAVALTRTAAAVRDATPAKLEQDLDRPTAFTKRGLFVRPARKDNLEAIVGFMDRQARYMRFQIEGGTRKPGPRGIKLPGNITLNSYGNIPKGVIDQLKQAAAGGALGSGAARHLGVSRRKGAAPIELFYGKPKGKGWEKAPVGIYRRIPGSPGKLVPVVLFEDTPARYKKRFDFERLARDVVARRFDVLFQQALAEALRTAR